MANGQRSCAEVWRKGVGNAPGACLKWNSMHLGCCWGGGWKWNLEWWLMEVHHHRAGFFEIETEPASKAISVIDQSRKLLKDTRKHGSHPSWPWLSCCHWPIYTLGGRWLLPQAAGSQRGCQHRGQRHTGGRHRTAQWHRATSGLWWTGDDHLETWHELGSSKPMWGKKFLSCLKLLFEVLPGRILGWFTGGKVLGGFWWRFFAYKRVVPLLKKQNWACQTRVTRHPSLAPWL